MTPLYLLLKYNREPFYLYDYYGLFRRLDLLILKIESPHSIKKEINLPATIA